MTATRRGPEPRISHEAVLAAARRLPRERLTMRALGRELGVTHGALYRYFPDLTSVLAALRADLAASMTPPADDLPWQDWLRETAWSIRRVSREHPEIGSPATRPVVLPMAQRMIAEGLKVLSRTFSPQDAMLALGLISRFAEAFARAELAPPSAAPEVESALAEAGVDVAGAPPYDADAGFERELDIVLAGIDATLPKRT